MDIFLEEHAVDVHSFPRAMSSLHTLIEKMYKDIPRYGLNLELCQQLRNAIKEGLTALNQFSRDVELCGSKKVPWNFVTPNNQGAVKHFFSTRWQEIASVWHEDKTFTFEHDAYTEKILSIISYFQKAIIHAGIWLDLYLKHPVEKPEKKFLQTYSNLRRLFLVQKQFITSLQGKPAQLKEFPEMEKKLREISSVYKKEIPAYDDAALYEQQIAHRWGEAIGAGTQKLLFTHAVVDGILKQEHLSNTVVSIMDPAISPEILQRIEQSSIMMALLRVFARKKYNSIQEGIDQGVPPSAVIKGVRDFIASNPPLDSIKTPILSLLRNEMLGKWIIDPAACLASFCWRPIQYPLRAVETIAQEMKGYYVSPHPRAILQDYLEKSVQAYHNKGIHLMSVPIRAEKLYNPLSIFFEADVIKMVSKFYMKNITNEDKVALGSFVTKYHKNFNALYLRYFPYKMARVTSQDDSIPHLEQDKLFNYWLRAIILKRTECENMDVPIGKKNPTKSNSAITRISISSLKSRINYTTSFDASYREDPAAQKQAAWLTQHVDPLFGYNLSPELRKQIGAP